MSVHDYFPPEAVTGFLRGLWQAALNGAVTGIVTWQATDAQTGIAIGALAALMSLGGRTSEGAWDARRGRRVE